jgi:hypothetical protein
LWVSLKLGLLFLFLFSFFSFFFFSARGKLGLQITFAENSKILTHTLVFETEDNRKSWLDDIKKYIQLCGPAKLSDRQIQQSTSKVRH